MAEISYTFHSTSDNSAATSAKIEIRSLNTRKLAPRRRRTDHTAQCLRLLPTPQLTDCHRRPFKRCECLRPSIWPKTFSSTRRSRIRSSHGRVAAAGLPHLSNIESQCYAKTNFKMAPLTRTSTLHVHYIPHSRMPRRRSFHMAGTM